MTTKKELAEIAIRGQEPEAALELFYMERGFMPAKHVNPLTKREYTNGNVWSLELSMLLNDFNSDNWLTFNQAIEMGFCVKKGSKGTHFTIACINKKKDKNEEEKESVYFKGGTVFNLNQLEELSEEEKAEKLNQLAEKKEKWANKSNKKPVKKFDKKYAVVA